MIITQTPYVDKNNTTHYNLIKHYSDKGMYILQIETGVIYAEAVDVLPCKYNYVETDTPIKKRHYNIAKY